MRRMTRRDLLAAGLLVLTLLAGLVLLARHARPGFDATPYVHPELRPFVPEVVARTYDFDAATVARSRRSAPGVPEPLMPGWSKVAIAGDKDAPPVILYLGNRGSRAKPRPAIVHFHGGGFIVGNARDAVQDLNDIAVALDAVAVTVDYRLAPETRYPGALDGNYAALRWVYRHAAELGVDPSRIALLGESAGGGHAAMLAIAARDRGEVPIAFEALVYPMLDDRTGSARQLPPQQGALIWTPASNRFAWTALLGVPAGSPHVPDGAVPARVANLRGLPPTWIGVGSIDLFAGEDVEYARRLRAAGVPTQLNIYPGAFHAFDLYTRGRMVDRFRSDLLSALRTGLRLDGRR